MSIDQAIALMTGLIEIALWTAGPVLGAALMGGVFIGIVQTATQVQEMSLAFVVKASCVMLVFLMAGSALASKAVNFTRAHFERVAHVVK